MTQEECYNALSRARLGRLGCAQGNQPYMVPFYFVYHDPYLYGFTTPGQKVEWMRANPLVCVEWDEVEDSDQWTSIIILGRYEEMPDTPEWEDERQLVHALLQQHAVWWEPGCASRAHHGPKQEVKPVYYRIQIGSTTGRRASPDLGAVRASCQQTLFTKMRGLLDKVLHPSRN
jgi:nitroimidazol reductase NimA-like FMN-containing flavoprotein (pyridoxamine 5'-phosphate oxidase superfamily)